jgi:hypothetical protein
MYGTMTERRPTPAQLKRRLARAPQRRIPGRQGQIRRGRLHLRGIADRALHLQQPQLPLHRSRAAPRPLLAVVLETRRQDRIPGPVGRGRRALPRVDRQPPPPRRNARGNEGPLPPSRRVHPRRPRPALPRSRAPPLSQLQRPKTPGYHPDTWISPGFARLRDRRSGPKTTCYQALPTRPEVATPVWNHPPYDDPGKPSILHRPQSTASISDCLLHHHSLHSWRTRTRSA